MYQVQESGREIPENYSKVQHVHFVYSFFWSRGLYFSCGLEGVAFMLEREVCLWNCSPACFASAVENLTW